MKINNINALKKICSTIVIVALISVLLVTTVCCATKASEVTIEPDIKPATPTVTSTQVMYNDNSDTVDTDKIETPAVDKVLLETPVLYPEYNHKLFYDITESNQYIKKLHAAIKTLEEFLGLDKYTYSDGVEVTIRKERRRLQSIVCDTELDIKRLEHWETEYYYAAKSWEFFMRHGYSQEVAAGLIGNFMIETAGMSLDIDPDDICSAGGHYGLCQWALKYNPEVKGMSCEEQLEYLHNDLEPEFKKYARLYKKGFTLDDFLAMKSPEDIAAAFARIYERPGGKVFNNRKRAARKAYEYFYVNIPADAEIVQEA